MQVSSGRDVERMSVVKLRHEKAGEAEADQRASELRGEKLSELSVMSPEKRPLSRRGRLGRWAAAVLIVVALTWLAVLFLPGLLNQLVGYLLGLLLELAG